MQSEEHTNVTKKCTKCGIVKPITDFYFRTDSKTYRRECKECHKWTQTTRKFGLDTLTFEKLLHKQQGRCAICNNELNSSRYSRLSIDHNHTTGNIRGLLCTNCNTALGLLKENISVFERAIAYLKSY